MEETILTPEGIYYRILYERSLNRLCLQYYVYWQEQNCLGFLPIADHKYDYEPIFIYIDIPNDFPAGIVNAGYSKALGASCRFRKTEVRMNEYTDRDFNEYPIEYKTSPEPHYPFGGPDGLDGNTCVKKYPITGAIYLNKFQPMFGISSCSHVFSGAEKELHGNILSMPTKKLDDQVLNEWYFDHYKDAREDSFGHDVSNAFIFPYVRYCDPKSILGSNT